MIALDLTMNSALKDIFFLNIEDAYSEAAKQHKIIDAFGRERRQYCYYDGALTDIPLPNFIQVSADEFVEFFSHNQLPIPQLIAISQDGAVHFNEMPADVIEEVVQYRRQYRVPEYVHFDTYFVDPLQALNVAKQRNRVACGHPTIDGLQICYYRGELPEHGFENLIHLELPDFEEFFIRSRLRMPENIEIPEGLEDEVKVAVRQDIAAAGDAIKRKRLALIQQLLNKAKALQPRMIGSRSPRMFIPSNRLTTVMQYSSQGIAKAFAGLGWDVLFYIQANDMEGNNMVDMLEKYIDFDPHACFYVNSLNNSFMHDDIVNVVWWQDLMPQLKERQPLKWRAKDFNFSISPLFDRYLEQCQAASVERLHFVIDDEVFHNGGDAARVDKIVFIGSSYLPVVNLENSQHQQALDSLVAVMEQGACFDEATVNQIAEASSLSYEFVFWKLLHYVIRDHCVKWLCADLGLPVDVYGRYWDQDAEVLPYYRGELQHGKAVADVYRTARYALVCHPFEINSQRLAEVAACGCIPVVYDCRDVAEPPHWDDYCLLFKTAEELQNILRRRLRPAKQPEGLAEQFTYRAAARRLIDLTDLRKLTADPAAMVPNPINVLPELCGGSLWLASDSEATQQACLVNLQSNLICLKQHRSWLYDALLTAWQGGRIEIDVEKSIANEYWQVSVTVDGCDVYRLDNIAWLEHKCLIAENTAAMTHENTCCYALSGLGSGYELLAAFRATELPIAEMAEFEVPVYLIESKSELWLLNLLLHDLQPLLAARRLRIYHDANTEAELSAEFSKFEVALPDMLFDLDPQAPISAERVYQLSLEAKQARADRHAVNLQQVDGYYRGINAEQWRQKFSPEQVGELRVMGFISRFSSFLKYCMRDWLDGFERLGATIELCSETENYYLSSIEHLIDDINRFKPDLILTIDHFRHEFEGIPESVPFVNWIQDMLPNIIGNNKALKDRDFNFVFSKEWVGMNKSPVYKDSPLEFLSLGYNDKIYFPISGAREYECDVLVITHLQDPEMTFDPIRSPEQVGFLLNENEKKIIDSGIISCLQLIELYKIIEKYISRLNISDFNKICSMRGADGNDTISDFNAIFDENNVKVEYSVMNIILPYTGNRLHHEYLMKMKTWPVSLLIDSNSDVKIHLYGRNWGRYPKFKCFSRGIAKNGQFINRVMNDARICLNVSPGITLHMRALEIMASCTFMLSRRNELDGSPLSDYFSDSQVVLYDDEADFLKKVKYYLENEDERNRISKNAFYRLEEIFSYKAVAENVLFSVKARLNN